MSIAEPGRPAPDGSGDPVAAPVVGRPGTPEPKSMLVERDPHRVRAAILEAGRLAEVFIEWTRRPSAVGSIYLGRVHRVLPGIQAAFVDIGLERDAFLFVDDAAPAPGGDEKRCATPRIEKLVTAGESLLVQVVKDPFGAKGARVTTRIALPGRRLVYQPAAGQAGVSRRIVEDDERHRLQRLAEELASAGAGLIVRTAAAGSARSALAAEYQELERRWKEIAVAASRASPPARIHQETSLDRRMVRDRFDDSFQTLWVESGEAYEAIRGLLEEMAPELVGRMQRFEGDGSLFDRFGVEPQIDRALRSRVWLDSGGYLVISPTEALVAIDVNTGRYLGAADLETTVVSLNLEAVDEIVRQIRLRDLAGIIVIDFIDMAEEDHRQAVLAALERALERDPARTQVLGMSSLGLVELTRKRTRGALESLLTQPCADCGGTGRVKSATVLCLELRRRLLQAGPRPASSDVILRVHPEVYEALRGPEQDVLQEIETTLGRKIDLESGPELARDGLEIRSR